MLAITCFNLFLSGLRVAILDDDVLADTCRRPIEEVLFYQQQCLSRLGKQRIFKFGVALVLTRLWYPRLEFTVNRVGCSQCMEGISDASIHDYIYCLKVLLGSRFNPVEHRFIE